jgi:methyltransferase
MVTSATGWLLVFFAFLALQRASELVLSVRNARRLRARGAREYGADHFPLLVLVHVLFPVALAGEFFFLGTRPGPAWPLWLAACVAAQGLRYASILALGDRWNVRIWVLPGQPLVRHGPYRFLPHPNYAAVVIELLAAPLLFGAWRTALGISLLNLFALGARIRAEDAALRDAGG